MTPLVRSALRGLVRVTGWRGRKGPHITRYSMYAALAARAGEVRHDGRTLAISHSLGLCQVLGIPAAQVVEANYPEANMLALPFADGAFVNVVADQVLEHVEGDPADAIRESFRVVAPGGVLVHTTCFINPVHEGPGDFWRFTPDALRLLCRDHEVITAGGWGNRMVWVVDALGLRFEPVPERRWHPLYKAATHADPAWPVVTWVMARKAPSAGSQALG